MLVHSVEPVLDQEYVRRVLCDGVLLDEFLRWAAGSVVGSVVQVGGDIGLHVGKNFIDSFPDRVVKSQLILLLNEAGRLGEKTGSGFYKYTNRKQAPDPALKEILDKSRSAADLSQARILSRNRIGPQPRITFCSSHQVAGLALLQVHFV